MEKKLAMLICSISILYYFCCWRLPSTEPLAVKESSISSTACLIPLDSRPVCTELPQELAHLAGVQLTLPPQELLDNYTEPANKKGLAQWLTEQTQLPYNSYYVSTDMLLSGGLIASRQKASSEKEQFRLLEYLHKVPQPPQAELTYFGLIPRLLVSDELIPDRWYKYHLLRYAQYYHIAQQLNDYPATEKLEYHRSKIPADILAKYTSLFQQSLQFNKQLLSLAKSPTALVLGQDDGAAFGLSAMAYEELEQLLSKQKANAVMTYGADEIAAMLVARSYLTSQRHHCKVAIVYAHPSIPNLYMPYQSTSVSAVLQEKLSFLGATEASPEQADLVLYVSCGNDAYQPSKSEVLKLAQLLHQNKPVALIDLTANFEEKELLLPLALKQNVPLLQLAAYAGWNTFSNSAGTALAQALIFIHRQQELSYAQHLALNKERVDLLCKRFLDDYVYEKQYHAYLKRSLLSQGTEPTDLDAVEKAVAEGKINSFINYRAQELLHYNLGQYPFYKDNTNNYYLRGLTVTATLPWHRIFEVKLKLHTEIGLIPQN